MAEDCVEVEEDVLSITLAAAAGRKIKFDGKANDFDCCPVDEEDTIEVAVAGCIATAREF